MLFYKFNFSFFPPYLLSWVLLCDPKTSLDMLMFCFGTGCLAAQGWPWTYCIAKAGQNSWFSCLHLRLHVGTTKPDLMWITRKVPLFNPGCDCPIGHLYFWDISVLAVHSAGSGFLLRLHVRFLYVTITHTSASNFIFWERVSLCILDWLGAQCVHHGGLEHRHITVSASQILKLRACTTTPG